VDDFVVDPDAVEYQIRNVEWAAESHFERGLRYMELHGLGADGDVIHTHEMPFDGDPHYPALDRMQDIVLALNRKIANS